nr:hypothetical protein CFP56_33670 [Quercus suber]
MLEFVAADHSPAPVQSLELICPHSMISYASQAKIGADMLVADNSSSYALLLEIVSLQDLPCLLPPPTRLNQIRQQGLYSSGHFASVMVAGGEAFPKLLLTSLPVTMPGQALSLPHLASADKVVIAGLDSVSSSLAPVVHWLIMLCSQLANEQADDRSDLPLLCSPLLLLRLKEFLLTILLGLEDGFVFRTKEAPIIYSEFWLMVTVNGMNLWIYGLEEVDSMFTSSSIRFCGNSSSHFFCTIPWSIGIWSVSSNLARARYSSKIYLDAEPQQVLYSRIKMLSTEMITYHCQPVCGPSSLLAAVLIAR